MIVDCIAIQLGQEMKLVLSTLVSGKLRRQCIEPRSQQDCGLLVRSCFRFLGLLKNKVHNRLVAKRKARAHSAGTLRPDAEKEEGTELSKLKYHTRLACAAGLDDRGSFEVRRVLCVNSTLEGEPIDLSNKVQKTVMSVTSIWASELLSKVRSQHILLSTFHGQSGRNQRKA